MERLLVVFLVAMLAAALCVACGDDDDDDDASDESPTVRVCDALSACYDSDGYADECRDNIATAMKGTDEWDAFLECVDDCLELYGDAASGGNQVACGELSHCLDVSCVSRYEDGS